MKRNLLSILVVLLPLVANADEYTDPQSKVVYTYEPGQSTASVKAGYDEVVEPDYGSELIIVYYPGSPDAAGNVVILDRFTVGTEEYVVTCIGEVAFRGNKNIKSVSIPKTVTTIGNYAFQNCDSLTSVQFPDGLTQIAPGLFYGCKQLASVAIPSSVVSIGDRAFSECSSLSSLSLPAGLTFIGSFAFYGTPWYNAQYNEAPDGLFYIGPQLVGYKGDKPTGNLAIKEGTTCVANSAFSNCIGLTSVTFPKTITFVDTYAFENCTGLKAVHITDLAAWCGIEFQWSSSGSSNPLCYAYDLYLNGEKVSDIVIPEGVTRIGNYAFDHCGPLTSVVIPDGVTSIGENAFRSCISLKSVTIPPSVAKIGGQAFLWCKKLNAVHISDLAAWCRISFGFTSNPLCYNARLYLKGNEVTDLVIPSGVTCIGDYAFEKCPSLTSVIIPEGVTSIGSYAFRNCSNLSNIAIPEGITSIGENVFDGCSGFTSISLPKSLSSIGHSAFAHCSGLSNITIPEGVTSIGNFAFDSCSGLTDITIPPSLTNISHGTFNECTKLTSVTIPNSVTFVSGFAFGSCSNLADVYCYADNAPSTEDRVFYNTPISSATLHVPAGSVDKYKATAPWNGFGNIVALSNVDWQEEPIFNENKTFTVGNSSCTRIIYQGRISYDFESALDSLTRKYEPILNVLEAEGHYSGEGLDINEEKINVDFNYDSREFKLLTFIDKANIYNYLFTTDVIDEKGNHYYFVICNDEPIVSFTKGQMATIILPTVPDADKGKYYRLDKCEDGKIIFEQEQQPRARVPYIIVPSEDFSIDPSTLDLEGLTQDAVSIDGISFIGTYTGEVLPSLGGEGSYYDIIDTTPDCQAEEGKAFLIGALRAYLLVNWDDPINHPGSKGPEEKLEIVLKDNGTSLTPALSQGEGDEIVNGKWSNGKCYDLSGRKLFGKPERGIYIEDGKKKVMR